VVIKYAEAHSNRAAGRQFDGIDETNIRRWRQQELAPAEGAAGEDATAQESQSKSPHGCPALEAKL